MEQNENFILLTSRLFWKMPGEDGYIAFGNVTNHKDEPDIQRVPHMTSMKGIRRNDFELIKSINVKKSFMLDEHFIETVELLNLGNRLADKVQNAAVNQQVDFLHADLRGGRVYELGKLKVSNVQVYDLVLPNTVNAIDPSKYIIDAETGLVTLLDASVIPHGMRIKFDCEAVTRLNFDSFSNLLSRGTFRQLEFDQHDEVPLTVQDFSGQVQVTAWGDNNGDKYNEFTLEVIVTG